MILKQYGAQNLKKSKKKSFPFFLRWFDLKATNRALLFLAYIRICFFYLKFFNENK